MHTPVGTKAQGIGQNEHSWATHTTSATVARSGQKLRVRLWTPANPTVVLGLWQGLEAAAGVPPVRPCAPARSPAAPPARPVFPTHAPHGDLN